MSAELLLHVGKRHEVPFSVDLHLRRVLYSLWKPRGALQASLIVP